MNFFRKLFVKRIESTEKLMEIGEKVFKEKDLSYKIYGDKFDYIIEILRKEEKIFEFVCNKVHAQVFFNEVVGF